MESQRKRREIKSEPKGAAHGHMVGRVPAPAPKRTVPDLTNARDCSGRMCRPFRSFLLRRFFYSSSHSKGTRADFFFFAFSALLMLALLSGAPIKVDWVFKGAEAFGCPGMRRASVEPSDSTPHFVSSFSSFFFLALAYCFDFLQVFRIALTFLSGLVFL